MQIISHRGYWRDLEEQNKKSAFERSFKLKFGTETDIRAHKGNLIISHDPAMGNELSLNEFLGIHKTFNSGSLPLALNIKSDGLQEQLKKALQKFSITNYFLFDMSTPDMLKSLKHDLKCFARCSEYEDIHPLLYQRVEGIWMDSFHCDNLDLTKLEKYLHDAKKVCLVSPELHGRDPKPFWQILRNSEHRFTETLSICTDIPEDFSNYIKQA